MALLNKGATPEDIVREVPDIKWVVLNRSVYDLTNFTHPGGNFLIKAVVGQNAERYFYGA